jgi:hypothetical protein
MVVIYKERLASVFRWFMANSTDAVLILQTGSIVIG